MEANATVNTTTFRCVTWRHGDPYPNFGETCGIDTETTLIDDIETTPDLAYAGFNIVYHSRSGCTSVHNWTPCSVSCIE